MKKIVNSELVTVIAIMGMSVLAMGVLQPVLPLYLTFIGIAPAVLGLMFSVAMIGMVIGESSGGWIADRVGLKLPLSVGTFLCAPVVFCFVLTRNIPAIFLIFFIWGIVRAAIFGPGRGYIGNTAPLSKKATFMAILATTLAVSRSLGALMSGFVADTWGYDCNFFISSGIALLGGVAVVRGLRRIPLVKPRLPAASTAPTDGSLSPKSAYGYRPFAFQCTVAALNFLGMGTMTFLPLLATQVVGVKATEVGILFTIGGLVTAVSLIPLGRLADRKGKRVLMILGLLVSAASLAGLAFAKSFPWLIISVIIHSLGGAMFSPAAVALLSDIVPAHWQSTAMGIYGGCEDIGVIAGSALGGLVWSAWGPPSTFLIGTIAAGVGAAICFGFIREKTLKKPNQMS